ncbi:ribonuclease HI family protein [Aerococcus sp. UMB1112A]|uniref:ribonuclease HI family protein n=1 Tax=Aerococcus sp. UMB1112A TaxID=3050609 RepID=UPI0025506A58|nr:ribonuclease HI family protein [Aerococcus sp. UMB1112A]MDK8501503.1 ribonuclease HI family protein [Aerococcus sp. UMB1112A]
MIRLAIDASVNVKDGRAGVGILWLEGGKQYPLKFSLPQKTDNHLAEFSALKIALELLEDQGRTDDLIICQTDSRAVYDAIRKKKSKNSPYSQAIQAILLALAKFPQFHLNWVPEADNRGADQLAKQAMRQASL